jgi:hypothetical protein
MLFVALLAGLVTIYLAWFAAQPVTDRAVLTADDWQRVEDETTELLARRDRLVEELRDIEFEAALSKLDDRDLADLRARYEAEAVDVMARLDEQVGTYQTEIDEAVQTRLGGPAAAEAAADDAPAASETAETGSADGQPAATEPAETEPAETEPAETETAESETDGSETAESETAESETDGSETAESETDGAAPVVDASEAICGACGASNRVGARFCDSCGAPLQEAAS